MQIRKYYTHANFQKKVDDTKSVIRSPNTRQYNGQKKKKGKQWSTQHQIKNNIERATQTHMLQKVEIKFSGHEQFLELPSTLSTGCFKNYNMII